MNSPTYHPSKSYIKAMIQFNKIDTEIPSDIIIPFFIDYSSAYPFILFIFQKNQDDKLEFIRNDRANDEDDKTYLENLFCNFHLENSTVFHRHSCFYELSNKNSMDMSGLLCDNNTLLWFSTQYEIYNSKSLFKYTFEDDVTSFFSSNQCLNELMWNNEIVPSPIIAYSINTFKKSKFHSTFGSERKETEPHYSLYNYQTIYNDMITFAGNDMAYVRYALFEPYSTIKENDHPSSDTPDNLIYFFSNYSQHTPLCFFKENSIGLLLP